MLRWILMLVLAAYLAWLGGLLYLRYLPPLVTMVQAQRRVEAVFEGTPYHKRYTFVPLARISRDFQHAVIAAEDSRFYQHRGIDWKELNRVAEQDRERGALGRGASTITQQLIKNLFFTTHRSLVRKGVEFTLAPVAERVLGKDRILELYLNVIEWGPGIYGAEAAARAWYGIPAAQVGREQAARLAAIIPAPRTRKPGRMNEYSVEIMERMRRMGW